MICDASGIFQSLYLISKGNLCSLEAGLGRWGQEVWGPGTRLGLSCLSPCTVSPSCSWHLVSSSKQIIKQVKLTLTCLRAALQMATGLNKALSLHATPGDITWYLHRFFPPQCSEGRRILQPPKMNKIMFGQEYLLREFKPHSWTCPFSLFQMHFLKLCLCPVDLYIKCL